MNRFMDIVSNCVLIRDDESDENVYGILNQFVEYDLVYCLPG